mmetsp:Transcript_25160/g.99214  ORF Transcript_25160/g.99214 Transcript_25160/m.99214 type:complete len:129 (-) Transcript_25160:1049-1435(-)
MANARMPNCRHYYLDILYLHEQQLSNFKISLIVAQRGRLRSKAASFCAPQSKVTLQKYKARTVRKAPHQRGATDYHLHRVTDLVHLRYKLVDVFTPTSVFSALGKALQLLLPREALLRSPQLKRAQKL